MYILILKILFFRPGGKSSIDADAIGIRHNIEQSHKKESKVSTNGNEEEKPIPKKSITQQLNEHRWGQFDR